MVRGCGWFGIGKGVLVAAFSVAWAPRGASAAEPGAEAPARHFGGQRALGFGPALGFYSGMGAVVNLELEPVGAVISGGYMPLLVFGNEGTDREPTLDYYGSGEVNADLLIGPLYRGGKMEIDLLAGYRYNSVLGHGGGAGVRFALDVSRLVRFEFHWTPNVFPDASDRLAERGYPSDRDASVPWFQGGLGAAAVFYP